MLVLGWMIGGWIVDESLQREIADGESKTLELKLTLPKQSEKYIKTMVAFANGAGGTIVIGVRDSDKAIVGVSNPDVVKDAIANAVSDTVVPLMTPHIYKTTVADKHIIVAEVYPGASTPYYIESLGMSGGTFVRVGATTRIADAAAIRELQLRGASQSYDEQIYVGADYSEKDAKALCRAIDSYRKKSAVEKGNEAPINKVTPKNLENWGLLTRFEGRLMPTRAFMLLTSNPFEFAQIQCAQFKGTDRVVFLDKREYGGPLYKQIEEAVQFVLRNIRYGAEIKGLLREESYELPIVAIREAIINATIHRSLQLTSRVQVALYDDRLEVSSPGALFGSLTLKKALAGSTALRNPRIAEVFKRMELFESWGTGLRRIRESCEKLGLPEPEFIEIDDLFRVNIFRPAFSASLSASQAKVKQKVKQNALLYDTAKLEDAIIELLSDNPRLGRKDLAQKVNVSESSVYRRLSALKKAKRIEHIGSAKDGEWRIIQ